ncbi:MAG: GNAT family N-acetyltransferase [Acidimicrobiales bacterium]
MDSTVLERIQAYVRRYATEQRQVERSGPFLATFGRHSNGPYLNYAVPDDYAEPTVAEVAGLAVSYERRSLRPRVELVPELAPSAAAALRRAGFKDEGVFQLMVCDSGNVVDRRAPAGIEMVVPGSEAEYTALVGVRQEAFGEPGGPTAADAERARSNVEGGGLAVVVVDTSSGQAVASGACLIPYGGVTELTSVGVLARFRRKGIGALITSTLARAAFESGVEIVYLTPAHDEGGRIYESVGFARAGESLHLGL